LEIVMVTRHVACRHSLRRRASTPLGSKAASGAGQSIWLGTLVASTNAMHIEPVPFRRKRILIVEDLSKPVELNDLKKRVARALGQ
jgi:hypothetical protein